MQQSQRQMQQTKMGGLEQKGRAAKSHRSHMGKAIQATSTGQQHKLYEIKPLKPIPARFFKHLLNLNVKMHPPKPTRSNVCTSQRRVHPQKRGMRKQRERGSTGWRRIQSSACCRIHTLLGYNLDRAGQKIHYRRIFCH